MSWSNKVVWSEGMFLRPLHFQQQTRHVESFVEARASAGAVHPWGFSHLKLDLQLLTLGKLAISEARGVFPDGTPFNIPDDDDPPPPLEIPEGVNGSVAYLAFPHRRVGMEEVGARNESNGLARYRISEHQVKDSNSGYTGVADIEVARLNLRLLLERDQLDEFACIGVARVVEVRDDKNVVLDDPYLASAIDCRAVPTLAGFATELLGLLHHRGEALAGRVTEAGRGGTAEVADFMLLQVVNRYEPVLRHLATRGPLHPETLYRTAVEIAGELATFTSPGKRCSEFPTYRHQDLQATFAPVMADLRRSLSMVLEQTAVPIPLEERKYGIRVAPILDRTLLRSSSFVLAVSASLATEEIRSRFPAQVKIGPVEKIRELVNVQLPGIGVAALPVAPRQLPYRTGCVYFELDRASEYFAMLDTSGGFALHLSGEFPGIDMELWAIKG
jgi:type VI secretion system protein ImpJ